MLKFKAIVFLGLSAVLVIAALILVVMNMGDLWELHFYWRQVNVRRGLMLLIAGVVGCVIWVVCRACLPAGITALRAAKRANKAKDAPPTP